MEVLVKRVSRNPQIKSFRSLTLPSNVMAVDELTGKEYTHVFLNRGGVAAAFEFDDAGKVILDERDPIDRENLRGLRNFKARGIPDVISYEIQDTNDFARRENERRRQMKSALDRLESRRDDSRFMESMARRLGMLNLDRHTVDEIISFVETRAETVPHQVIDILDDVYQQMHFAIDEALESGGLGLRNGVYFYGQQQIGASEDSVVAYLSKYPEVYADLQRINGRRYLNEDNRAQAYLIRDELVKTSDPVVPYVVSEPLPPTPMEEVFTPAASAGDSTVVDLFEQALALGVLKPMDSGIYRFDRINLSAASVSEDPREQAIACLSNPKNKTVRAALEAQIKRVS